VRQEIQTRSHDGSAQQEAELTDIKKEARCAIDEERMIFRERVRIVHVQEFDAKEHQASGTNKRIVFQSWRLVFKELTSHHHNALQQKPQ
jgi:hypothetical protein